MTERDVLKGTLIVTIDEAGSCHPERSRKRSEGSGAPGQAHIGRCRGIPYYVLRITNNIDFSSIRDNVLPDCYYRTMKRRDIVESKYVRALLPRPVLRNR